MTTFTDIIEMPGVLIEGTMQAEVFEIDGEQPTHLIRLNQDWGIRIQWEMRGTLINLMDGTWRVQVLLERIGLDTPTTPDYDLPVKDVSYRDGVFDPAANQMMWDVNLDIGHGQVVAGTYKLVTVLHLYDLAGNPTDICGLDEQEGLLTVYKRT